MFDISIIIPAYNVENYVSEAVDSVLNQTHLPYEVIIINDGSTDETAHKLKKYESNPIVRIIHTENYGLGPARNHGLNIASGDYVYFFDSDDRLDINFVGDITKEIMVWKQPEIIFFAGESFFDKDYDGNFFPIYERRLDGLFFPSDFPIKKMMESRCFYPSACLYISKRALWSRNGLRFKNIIHEDEELIFPLVSSAENILIKREVYFYRRLRNHSIMTSPKSRKTVAGYAVIFESLLSFYDKEKDGRYFDHISIKKYLRALAHNYSAISSGLSFKLTIFLIIKAAIRTNDYKIILYGIYPLVPKYIKERIYSFMKLRNI